MLSLCEMHMHVCVCIKTHLLVLTVTLGGPLSLAFSSLPSSSFLLLFLMSLIEYANDSKSLRRWFVFLPLRFTFSLHQGAPVCIDHTYALTIILLSLIPLLPR